MDEQHGHGHGKEIGAGGAGMEVREWLKPSEVAPLLGVTTKRVYQLIHEGQLPGVEVGGAMRIPRRAWDDWLARLNSEALGRVWIA